MAELDHHCFQTVMLLSLKGERVCPRSRGAPSWIPPLLDLSLYPALPSLRPTQPVALKGTKCFTQDKGPLGQSLCALGALYPGGQHGLHAPPPTLALSHLGFTPGH